MLNVKGVYDKVSKEAACNLQRVWNNSVHESFKKDIKKLLSI